MVNVYPNLTSGLVYIESTKESEEIMHISVTGLSGKQVYKTSTYQNNYSIDLTSETPGIYIVNIQAGNVSKAYKIIKK